MVTIDSLSFAYSSGIKRTQSVFNNLSMNIQQGRSVGILGANGVGKSTLLRLIAGTLTPAFASNTGTLRVLNHAPRDRALSLMQQMFIVPEAFELPDISGHRYASQLSSFYPLFDQPLFSSLLERFELDRQNILSEMSFGQKKKFLVAFALATRCPLILMDEPTNGMDIPSKSAFRDAVIQTQTDNQTILISTHQVRDLESIIDSVVLMNNAQSTWVDLNRLTESISQIQGESQDDVLYSESRLGTQVSLVAAALNNHIDIDLELLFNAFHYNSDGLLAAIESSSQQEESA